MASPGPHPDDVAAAHFAGIALMGLRRGDIGTATAALEVLYDRHGDQGVYVAMLCWADVVIEAAGGPTRGGPVGLALFDAESGTRHHIDDAPHWARWAGRFITARATGDIDQCKALVGACVGEQQATECFNGLLHMTAETLNAYADGSPRRVNP